MGVPSGQGGRGSCSGQRPPPRGPVCDGEVWAPCPGRAVPGWTSPSAGRKGEEQRPPLPAGSRVGSPRPLVAAPSLARVDPSGPRSWQGSGRLPAPRGNQPASDSDGRVWGGGGGGEQGQGPTHTLSRALEDTRPGNEDGGPLMYSLFLLTQLNLCGLRKHSVREKQQAVCGPSR